MKVEEGDRRFYLIQNSRKKVGDHSYFDTLPITQEASDYFLSYLYYFDAKSMDNLRKIPHTQLRQFAMERGIPNTKLFLRALAGGETKLVLTKESGGWISASCLFGAFQPWATTQASTAK